MQQLMRPLISLLLILAMTTPAFAQDATTTVYAPPAPSEGLSKRGKVIFTSAMLMATGAALTAFAFDYDTSCGPSESTHYMNYNGYEDTACVYLGQTYSSVTDPTTTATFQRPGLLWAGIATAGTGAALLFFLPKKAADGVQLAVTPGGGWKASKTLSF